MNDKIKKLWKQNEDIMKHSLYQTGIKIYTFCLHTCK